MKLEKSLEENFLIIRLVLKYFYQNAFGSTNIHLVQYLMIFMKYVTKQMPKYFMQHIQLMQIFLITGDKDFFEREYKGLCILTISQFINFKFKENMCE